MRHVVAATLFALVAGCAAQGVPLDEPGGGGGSDGGLGMLCHQVPCGNNAGICKMIGCGACTAAGTCGN
jgi:hypothetical protein